MVNALIIFGLALVFACGCSVFDLFRSAGAQWNFSNQKINTDYRNYLKTDHVPTYVHEFLHRHPLHRNRTYQRLVYNGGRPPYL